MTYAYFIGVDPGVEGGLAVIEPDGTIAVLGDPPTLAVMAMPRRDNPPGGELPFDLVTIRGLIDLVEDAGPSFAFIEGQPPIRSRGAQTNHVAGRGFGALEATWILSGVRYEIIPVPDWQSIILGPCRTGQTKAVALRRVRTWYPAADLRANKTCRSTHSGIVDALCIARFASMVAQER